MDNTASLSAQHIAAEVERRRAQANAEHAQWPQYNGLFDGWVLGRILKTVHVPGQRNLCTLGDLVLLDPQPETIKVDVHGWRTIYVEGHGSPTMVPPGHVEEVRPEVAEPVTVGQFTYDPNTETVTGPDPFLTSDDYQRWLDDFNSGRDVVFQRGATGGSPNAITAMLVSLQTCYAGWHGRQTLGLDGRS